jgi:hypothetical protein
MPNHPPAQYRQSVVRPDTFVWEFTFKQGVPAAAVSVAGEAWAVTVRHGETDAVIAALTSAGGAITLDAGGVTGAVRVTAATAAWPLGEHKYDLVRTTAAGVRRTLARGPFAVTEAQTR